MNFKVGDIVVACVVRGTLLDPFVGPVTDVSDYLGKYVCVSNPAGKGYYIRRNECVPATPEKEGLFYLLRAAGHTVTPEDLGLEVK